MTNLDNNNGTCNILDDKYARICVLNTIEDVNLNVVNMIIRIN